MPISQEDAAREAIARVDVNLKEATAFEFLHSTLSAPIRIVDHDVKLDLPHEATAPENPSETVEYLAASVKAPPAEINGEVDSSRTITLQSVSGLVQRYLAAANKTTEPIEVIVRDYHINLKDLSVIGGHNAHQLQVRGIKVTSTQVAITLGYKNSANQNFGVIRTAQSHPGLST